MKHYVNKDDFDEKFWENNYLVHVTVQDIQFVVNADNEQDALDYVMDWVVDNDMPGLWTLDFYCAPGPQRI